MQAPSLDDGLEFFNDAFFELSTERSSGFDEGPIPISAIFRYADHYKMTEDEETDLIYLIRAMDNAYLKYRNKKNATKTKKK